MECIKYLLFIFNFIFSLCGLAIIAIGAFGMNNMLPPSEAFDSSAIRYSSITLIIVGSIIFIIAFFGCCGAIRESHWMTVTFAIFMLTLLVIQVAIAVYLIVVVKKIDQSEFTDGYWKLFNRYKTDQTSKYIIDELQSNIQCCGVTGPNNFSNNNENVPGSCCGKGPDEICYSDNVYQEGCSTKLYEKFIQFGKILGGVVIGIGAVEVIGIIFSLCLANSIKNKHRRGYEV